MPSMTHPALGTSRTVRRIQRRRRFSCLIFHRPLPLLTLLLLNCLVPPLAFPLLTLCKACTSPYSVPFFVSYCLAQQILQQGWQLLQLHLVISLLRQAFGIDQAIRY